MNRPFTDVSADEELCRLGRLYPIILMPYNAQWKALYEKEKAFLQSVFGESLLRINHIGSTSVEGLLAKPTIDILLEISDEADSAAASEKMLSGGYIINRPQTDLIMYIKGYGKNGFEGQTYHVHVRNLGDHNELYFRDYLTAYSDVAAEYALLKLGLREKYEHDRDGYTEAKGGFITHITKLARVEFSGRYNAKTAPAN